MEGGTLFLIYPREEKGSRRNRPLILTSRSRLAQQLEAGGLPNESGLTGGVRVKGPAAICGSGQGIGEEKAEKKGNEVRQRKKGRKWG